MQLDLDINEIKRYIKYDGKIIDEVTKINIEKAIALVEKKAQSKFIQKTFFITCSNDEVVINDTNIVFTSKSLSQHLKNCNQIIILVATLGLELDYLIRKLEITDIGLAYIVNGVAVEYIEKYLDNVIKNDIIIEKNRTSRFSIGYNDLSLEHQDDIIKLLDATKKIGVNVLETHVMVPSKSVTALIGLSDLKLSDKLKKCDSCLDNGCCSGMCIGKEN